ncbi:hypothetical protein PCYB_001850 [Plasmodium cynomolgi strain B]|uniref:VIR protein n=1 Tax=Plasmodium cynomolgi (strain B) TaxID=1120755 RepID=K6VJ65_PLACD|nr:hypothetical protein PCYB_001850 [Plasmodium cynomolgi strain B]GAB69437.1 hypothetical protein PCYB_001850 [Plasmodium cynomolgi strain B]
MHDYFKNFDHLKDKTKDKLEDKKYCEYVSAIASLYKDYLSECCTYFFFGHHWDHCANFFKCDKDLNPYKLLKEFNCGGEFLPQYPESLVQSLIIDRSVILRSRKIGCRGLTCDPFYMTILFAFLVLGIFYLSFFLYKFTPLGSMVNRKERKKQEMNRYFEEKDEHKPPPKKLQQGQANASKKRIKIAYNPT